MAEETEPSGPPVRRQPTQVVQLQQQMQEKLNKHVHEFPVHIKFPAKVSPADADKRVRTNSDLIQHRLLEAGVKLDDVQKLGELTESVSKFIADLNRTGCFHSVKVRIEDDDEEVEEDMFEDEDSTAGGSASAAMTTQSLNVVLKEKRWFSAYIGGGLKHETLHTGADSLLPKVQFETWAKLLNLSGHLDTTSLNYAIDQTSSTRMSLSHERPLYTMFPEYTPGYNSLLTLPHGSKISIAGRAVYENLDYEWTRSYKECQRLLAVRLSNVGNIVMPAMADGGYRGFEWMLLLRDVMPRRHPTDPYACDASPEIVSLSGPSLKHSVSYEVRSNGRHVDNRFNPTSGIDYHGKVEMAGPPGDVGFCKLEGGISYHMPLQLPKFNNVALHGAFQSGILRSLSWGGLCMPRTISDRFYTGGPMELRGFVPAGIGPRARTGGKSTPGGDSLGGDFFYTATLAASVPFSAIRFLGDNGVRLFGFANIGTLTGLDATPSLKTILWSTRASVGGGMSIGTGFGRVEITYAVPLRYGPRDARKSVQGGIGFTFG